MIQKEAESGRELSQLLGELIGCLRALLVAKLDPSADGEGIPAALWDGLRKAADEYAPDRILAAIDVFAETEGRMKWATNKRLHFELGVIKAIQSLGEVRIADIIKVLTKGADYLPTNFAQPSAPAEREPDSAPQVKQVQPQPTPEPAPAPQAAVPQLQAVPEPEPVAPVLPEPEIPAAKEWKPAVTVEANPAPAASKPKPTARGIAGLDSFIADAPETSDFVPEPPPAAAKPEPLSPAATPAPAPVATAPVDDAFYNDPLIQSALVKFQGKVLG